MYAPTLLESRRRLASRGAVGGGAVSFAVHSALIAAAVYATMFATRAAIQGRLVVDLPPYQQPETAPPKPALLTTLGPPPPGFNTLVIPTDILAEIPPPSHAPFDPASFAGVGVRSASPWGSSGDTLERAAPRAEPIYEEAMLEELPFRLSGEAPRYPALLMSARIEGETVLELVVDTAGLIEARSLRIVRSTNRLFDQSALVSAATWRFRPAKIGGMVVRARVHFPVRFTM